MLKLDLNKKYKTINGIEGDKLLADILAEVLSAGSDEDYAKVMDTARKLSTTKVVDLGRQDMLDLKKKVTGSQIINLIKEQIIAQIDIALDQKDSEGEN